jgi:hypothetical protein
MIDLVLLALWLVLLTINRAALLPLIVLAIDNFTFYGFTEEFPRLCITAISCVILAQTNLNINHKLRYALLASGCIYWLGAIDDLLYTYITSYEGIYYNVMPYAVITLNAYIAALLFTDRERNLAGITHSLRCIVNYCAARL